MPNEAQVKTDSTDQTVADQDDAAESTISGTNELAAYEAELAAAMSAAPDDETQGDNLAEVEQADDTQETDEVPAEEQAEEQPEEVADEVEDEPEEKPKDRFRFKDPTDQAVAAIAKAKGVSLVEAAKIFEGVTPTKHQEQSAEQSQEVAETVDSVQARIEELEDMEAEASTALEFETANEHRKEANKLRNKLIDLKIAEVQEKTRTEIDAERKFLSDYAASEAEAVKYYPDAAKADSPLHKEILRLEAEMRELGDPLYFSEKKPFSLTKKAAKNLGIPMTNPNATAPKKEVQNRPIQPAGGNARTTTPTTPLSKIDQAVDSVKDEASYDALVAELLS